MYSLTLNLDERRAFDWVGHRYATGADFASVLLECMPGDVAWSDAGEITFAIPEHKAWELSELAEQEGGLWPCFAPELVAKLDSLIGSIV